MSIGSEIRITPFHQMHVDAGAKMVPFAGYEMPVSYPLGIKKEHNHTLMVLVFRMMESSKDLKYL